MKLKETAENVMSLFIHRIIMSVILIIILNVFFVFEIIGAPVDHPWHYQSDLLPGATNRVLTQWKLVDSGWRPRVRPGMRWNGDFYPFDEHYEKWVIVSTNRVTRPISVKAHSKFQDKIDEMEPGYKKQKALDKASIKFGKKLFNEREKFEKYLEKAATDNEREFWKTLLDILPVPN